MIPRDPTNQRFGRLVAIRHIETHKTRGKKWLFRCDCGNEHAAFIGAVRFGQIACCGCAQREAAASACRAKAKHGGRNSGLYARWRSMISRCENPNNIGFKNHGKRGIRVCPEWRASFEAFRDWAFESGAAPGLTIERINTNGNYEPSNCRWATQKEQANNRRDNRLVSVGGAVKTAAEWAESAGLAPSTVLYRLNAGVSPDEAISAAPDHGRRFK